MQPPACPSAQPVQEPGIRQSIAAASLSLSSCNSPADSQAHTCASQMLTHSAAATTPSSAMPSAIATQPFPGEISALAAVTFDSQLIAANSGLVDLSAAVPFSGHPDAAASLDGQPEHAADACSSHTATDTPSSQPASAAAAGLRADRVASAMPLQTGSCVSHPAGSGVVAAGCQKHRAARKGRRRGLGRSRKRGVTPDHMLYWLLHMRTTEQDVCVPGPLSQSPGSSPPSESLLGDMSAAAAAE